MTDFFHSIHQLDIALFDLLNGPGTPFWDGVMATFSSKVFWIPFYLYLLLWTGLKRSWVQALGLLVLAILAVALSDQTASGILKPWIQRPRPCRSEADLSIAIHLVNDKCGGLYGFASSHAANFFAMATVISGFLKKSYLTFVVFLIAILVAYSRIYLGVHYPGDVLVGALIGCFWATILLALYRILGRNWQKNV